MRAAALILGGIVLASCDVGPYDTFASGFDHGCASGRYDCFTDQVYDHSSDLTWLRGVGAGGTGGTTMSAAVTLGADQGSTAG